ncbi:MAG: hypothetical protein ACN4E2_04145 [Nitrospinota bacterium]
MQQNFNSIAIGNNLQLAVVRDRDGLFTIDSDMEYLTTANKVVRLQYGSNVYSKVVTLPPIPENEINATLAINEQSAIPFKANNRKIARTVITRSDESQTLLMSAFNITEISKA